MWPALSALVSVSAVLDIAADVRGSRRAVYILKPLTTTLIIAIAVLSSPSSDPLYRALIYAGLIASLGGDVFLMLPGNRVAAGLGCFLAAHLCYIGAFSRRPLELSWGALALLVVYGVALVTELWPHLGRIRPAVIVYAGALVLMVWLAVSAFVPTRDTSSLAVMIGALLFLVSDSVLANERFRRRHAWGQPLVLSTYFTAQWLIASSLHLAG